MNPIIIAVLIILTFVAVVSLGVSISAQVKANNSQSASSVRLKEDATISGIPETFEVVLTAANAFSTNQYIFIENFGNFIVNGVEGNLYTLFNQQAVSDSVIPSGAPVHPSGNSIFTRTTRPGTITTGTFNIFVRDASLLEQYVIFQTSSGLISLPILDISSVSNIENKLSVLNVDSIGVGSSFTILAKVAPSAPKGTPGTSGSGLLAKVGSALNEGPVSAGQSLTLDIAEGLDNLHGLRSSPETALYIYIFSVVNGTNYNIYYRVTAIGISDITMQVVNLPINDPYTGALTTLVIAQDTGIFFAGDSYAYTPFLASGNIFIGNGSGYAQEQTMTGDVHINSGGVTTIQPGQVTNAKLANNNIGLILNSSGTDADVTGSPAVLGSSLTLSLPSSSATNRGLLTSADWTAFDSKLDKVLTDGQIYVGNGSNQPVGVPMGGDATLSNTGILTIKDDAITTSKILNNNVTDDKLMPTGIIGGSYTNVNLSVNPQGRITAIANGVDPSSYPPQEVVQTNQGTGDTGTLITFGAPTGASDGLTLNYGTAGDWVLTGTTPGFRPQTTGKYMFISTWAINGINSGVNFTCRWNRSTTSPFIFTGFADRTGATDPGTRIYTASMIMDLPNAHPNNYVTMEIIFSSSTTASFNILQSRWQVIKVG